MSNEAPFRPGTEPGPLVLFLGVARPGEYETLLEAGWPLGLVRDTDSEFARHAPGGFQVIEEVPFSAGVAASGMSKQCAASLSMAFCKP